MQHSLAARTARDDASMYLEGRRKQIKRGAIRHTILSDVSMTFERGLAEVRHAYAGHPRATAPPAPVHRGFRRPAHAKTTPARWRVGCVGCTRERNWVRQTRGRPSQAEARESSRRFRLEAVPWKPPRSPSSLPPRSTVVPSTSPYTRLGPIPSPVEREWARRVRINPLRGDTKELVSDYIWNGLVATPFSLSSSIRFRMIERVFGNFWKEDWKGKIGNVILINLGYFFEILSILWVDLFFVAFTHSSFSLHSCWWHWEIFGHMDRFGSIRFHISFCI